MKALLLYFLKGTFGKKRMQRFYESLFRLSLHGMNYGNGGDYQKSGELNVLSYVKDRFRNEKKIVVFDVGANVGNYSIAVARTLGEKATIHCFEPSAKTYVLLAKNTAGLNNITLNNFGIGEVASSRLLYTDREGSGLASVYQRELGYMGVTMDVSEEIKVSTLDEYCTVKNIDRLHFLKLDIEGHELSALKGARKLISEKKIDLIQFEFGGTSMDSRTYFHDFYTLLKNDYKIYRILKDGLFELPGYKITYEIFDAVNFLAARH